jgi:plastocyanin
VRIPLATNILPRAARGESAADRRFFIEARMHIQPSRPTDAPRAAWGFSSRLDPRRARQRFLLLAVLGAAGACAHETSVPRRVDYVPVARAITVTTVPLLVKEQAKLFPFLMPAFAKGGVLDGKEVYAFSPSTITVVAGDTIHFTFVNPEDDVHSFVLPDLAVPLPGGKTTTVTYVAKRPGIYPILCAIQSHLPMMSGQLVVLSPAAVAGSAEPSASGRNGG